MNFPTLVSAGALAGIRRLCSRLQTSARVNYRRWLLGNLRTQLDRLELAMSMATERAIDNAKRHRHDPALQEYRAALRIEHSTKARRWLTVRRELDTLERTS